MQSSLNISKIFPFNDILEYPGQAISYSVPQLLELNFSVIGIEPSTVPATKEELTAHLKTLAGKKFTNKAKGITATISGESANKISRAVTETITNLTRLGYSEEEAAYIHRAAATKIGELFEQSVLFLEEDVYHNSDNRESAWHFFEPVTVPLNGRDESFLTNISVIKYKDADERLFCLELTIENPISSVEDRALSSKGRPAQRANGVSDVRLAAFNSYVKKERTHIERKARKARIFPWRVDKQKLKDLKARAAFLNAATLKKSDIYAKDYQAVFNDPSLLKAEKNKINTLRQLWSGNPLAHTELAQEMADAYNKQTLDGWASVHQHSAQATLNTPAPTADLPLFNSPEADHSLTPEINFNVIGQNAKTWDKYKHRAFTGRDDNLPRAELDTSQAKLKTPRMQRTHDSVARELQNRIEYFRQQLTDRDRWEYTRNLWAQGKHSIETAAEADFLRRLLRRSGITFDTLQEMCQLGICNIIAQENPATAAKIIHQKLDQQNVVGYNQLGDILDFPELFQAYPQLKTLPIRWMNDNFRYRGVYSTGGGHVAPHIELYRYRNPGGKLSTILHEVQHWIQHHEGFAFGTTPGSSRDFLRRVGHPAANDPGNLSRRFAGEIESRNVQARRWLTPEERIELPFNDTLEYPGRAISYSFPQLLELNFSLEAEREMHNVLNCVDGLASESKVGILHNPTYGDFTLNMGRKGKKGYGALHIHENRRQEGFTDDEAAFILVTALKAAEAEQYSYKQGNRMMFEKYGVRTVVAENPDGSKPIVTGFVLVNAGDESHAASPHTNFYALDELGSVQLVGASAQKALALFSRIVNDNPTNWEQIVSATIEELKQKQTAFKRGESYSGSPLVAFSAGSAQSAGMFHNGVMHTQNAIITAPESDYSLEGLHASPHLFYKFDTAYIGTGEGAQAYGWGLYFAGNIATNHSYFRQFSKPKYFNQTHAKYTYKRGTDTITEQQFNTALQDIFAQHATQEVTAADLAASLQTILQGKLIKNWTLDREIADYRQHIAAGRTQYAPYLAALQHIKDSGLNVEINIPKAINYRTALNCALEDLLTWDYDIPQPLLTAYLHLRDSKGNPGGKTPTHLKAAHLYPRLVELLGTPKEASMWIADQGYKGIKHIDAVSRGKKTPPTFNYIIFANEDVKITAINQSGTWSMTEGWQDYTDPEANFSLESSLFSGELQNWQRDPIAALGELGTFGTNIRNKLAAIGTNAYDTRVRHPAANDPGNLSRRFAGEIESRNVQARRWLTPEERIELPFNDTLEYPGQAISYSFPQLLELNFSVDAEELTHRFNTIRQADPISIDNPTAFQPDIKAAIKSVREKYRELQNNPVTMKDGKVVHFSGSGFLEIKNHAADRRVIAVIPQLRELCKSAEYMYSAPNSEPNKPKKADISQYHYYLNKASFTGNANDAYFLIAVAERTNGEFFYDLDASDIETIENIKGATDTLAATRVPNSEQQGGAPKRRLHNLKEFVNQFQQTLPLTPEINFNVIGQNAKTWDKYKHRAFTGRDDNLPRAEIDASQAFITLVPEYTNIYLDLVNKAKNGELPSVYYETLEAYHKYDKLYNKKHEEVNNYITKQKENNIPYESIQNDPQYIKLHNEKKDTEEKHLNAYHTINQFVKDYLLEKEPFIVYQTSIDNIMLSIIDQNKDSINRVIDELNQLRNIYKKTKYKLYEVLHFDELYEAYPQLKNVDIKLNHDRTATDSKSIIYISSSSANIPESILHEVQHIIQEIEGFAKGANLDSAAEYARIRATLNPEKYGHLKNRDPYWLYHRFAGEIEARNVSKRRLYSAVEREMLPFNSTMDVPAYEALVNFSVEPTYTVLNDNVGLQEHLKDIVTPIEINFTPTRKKGGEWVKEALDYYLQELAGQSLPIGNTGYTLHVKATKNRAKLSTYNANTQARSETFKKMKEIISKSYRLGSEPSQSREKESAFRSNQVAHTATFERFGYPVKVDGEIRMFWFTGQTKSANDKNVLLAESGLSEATKGDTALTWSSQDATMPPRSITLGDTLLNVKGKIKGMPEIVRNTPEANFSLESSLFSGELQNWQRDPIAALGELGTFSTNIQNKLAAIGTNAYDTRVRHMQEALRRRIKELQHLKDGSHPGEQNLAGEMLAIINQLQNLLPHGYRFGLEPYIEFATTYAKLHADGNPCLYCIPPCGLTARRA